jgi:hypothetical protein
MATFQVFFVWRYVQCYSNKNSYRKYLTLNSFLLTGQKLQLFHRIATYKNIKTFSLQPEYIRDKHYIG